MPRRPLTVLVAIVAIAPPVAGAEPAKLAESARFDISADAAVRSLDDGRAIEGGATIGRMNWVPEAERSRSYTVSLPVTDRGWRTAAIRFTPARSGTIHITLMGPWEEAQKGVLYKQEVLWDDVRVDGATLVHGGFEPRRGRGRSASTWQGPGVVTSQTPDVPAFEGTHYARTWHNQPLFAPMAVTGGRPVTIRLSARAVRPEGFVEMRRIIGRSTPAHRAAKRFLRGANLGNGLEAPPGQDWGVHYTPDDLRHIRAEGFDHARIPIGWHHYTGPGPGFRIKPEFFARVDVLVDAGLTQGLGVLINIHHFDDFTTDPRGQTPKFLAIWEQLAAHYARAPEGLAFELLNEPRDAATTEVVNPIFAEATRHIRRIDPKRTIFVGPGRWNSVDELSRLRLPDDDENLIVTVHSYDPFFFTHQGATWAGPDTKVTGIVFPGPPRTRLVPDSKLPLSQEVRDRIERYNTEPAATNPCSPRVIQAAVDKAREWSDDYGRPIHFGEFGCFTSADPASRANYYRAFREAAERAGIGWAIWDWKAGFRYWDDKAGRPEPGMREALLGRSATRTSR
jgi:endoglucanase